jgi:hypothetical protein
MKPEIEWLMQGDPALRWQVMRDLLDAPQAEWAAERRRTLETGWVARLLERQEEGGGWGGGVYSPKWVSTTYTMLLLCDMGVPPEQDAVRRGAEAMISRLFNDAFDEHFKLRLAGMDRCIVGMALHVGAYAGLNDERTEAIVQNLLDERMPDQAWNCERHRKYKPQHSSVHTTINVLEGLREYIERGEGGLLAEARQAEQDGLEFLLRHRLYKSHLTGEVISEKFTLFSYPPRWFYDVLRGLAFFARAGAPKDERLQDAIELLRSRRRKDGTWAAENDHTGKVHFRLGTGNPARWNTLRALRVLKWWEG